MSKTKQHYLHAIKVAIIREEKEFEGIPLPSPQKTGTGFQRQTYAKMKAEEFYAEHFEQAKPKYNTRVVTHVPKVEGEVETLED